jgi:hypothetical protein
MQSIALNPLVGSLVMTVAVLGPWATTLHAQGPPGPAELRGSILFVPVAQADLADRQRVHDRMRPFVTTPVSGRHEAMPDVVVLTDTSGQPILPDLAKARARGGARVKDANTLSFTFESPQDPWTAEDLAFLTTALADFYPVAREIYGPPAFDIVVNVRKDPNLAFAGFYDLSSNEMTLRAASTGTLDVLCHELFHAFRDDYLIGLASYEEGMARAAEIEVFNRVPGYVHPFDQAHGYTYDVYYEALNRPVIGAFGGNLNDGYVSFLLRYQLAGYAWGKALIENDRFLARFNRLYYDQVADDPATRFTESSLRRIAARVQKRVEGTAFDTWYERQHILNTAPPVGFALYQRIDNFIIDALVRDPSGFVTMVPDLLVDWKVTGYDGTLLDAGSALSAANGHVAFNPVLPEGYIGRLEVQASAFGPDGQPVEDVAYRPFISTTTGEAGVFGVVIGRNEGTVVITSLDRPRGRVTAAVVNGVFSVPELEGARGRFVARLYAAGRLEQVREFTKDASRYLVVF